MTSADDSAPVAPESIGRYRIVQRLAIGAGGEVYKGFDPVLQRPLAVKLLRVAFDERTAATVDRIKERFYREIQRVAALVHPAIARLFDGGEAPGGFFIATEFIEGASLADVLAESRPLEATARLLVLRQIADALEYARQHDTPHLNLKTTSVLMCADGSVKVGGFGVARVAEVITPARSDGRTTIPPWVTRFTAPEMAAGGPADARADVYSFAAVAVELFGGAPVDDRDARPARWTREGAVPSLPVLASDTRAPAAAAALVPALSANVDARYPTVVACFDAFSGALGFARRASGKLWEMPSAAAGMTADQLKQIDSVATQAGLPTFVKKVDSDQDETFAGPAPERKPSGSATPIIPSPSVPASEVKKQPVVSPPPPIPAAPAVPVAEQTAARAKPPSVAPSSAASETILIPRAKPVAAPPPESPAATTPSSPAPPRDPSEAQTTYMPAPPKAARFERGEPSAAPAARPADQSGGQTVLIPRTGATPPQADADVGKTVLIPRGAPASASSPAADDPARTVLIPASRKPPAAAAPIASKEPDKREQESTAKRAPVSPPSAAGAAAATSPARVGAPRPAAPAPPSRSIAFPPPPPVPATASAPGARASVPVAAKKPGGGGVVVLAVGLVVLIAAVAAFFYVPAVRQLWSRQAASSPSALPADQAPTSSAATTTVPRAAAAPEPSAPVTTPSAAPAVPAPIAPQPSGVGVPAPPTGTPPEATGGSLRITSTPSGASVSVDGRRRGVTPLRVGGIAFGDHAIELTLDGYNADRQRISLTSQRASRALDVKLTKTVVAPTTGAVSIVTEPAGARILVDGAAAGNAPLTVANLTPGRHAVQTEREGFEVATRDVDIKAGETASLNIRLSAAPSRPAAAAAPIGPLPFDAVETKPRLVRGGESPPYPRAAAQARIAGVVQIAWIVAETGVVSDVQVIESSSKLFETEVVAWARGLRYEPGRQAGKPVKVRIVRRFSFQPGR